MIVTFDELVELEGAWVDVQLGLDIEPQQIAKNLGYILAK